MVAAFGDLQVRVVTRRQSDPLWRHQVEERIVQRRQLLVHRADHLLVSLRSRDLEHARMTVGDGLRLGAEATGDDHLAVARERFADRVEGLVHRVVDEAAGVDDDEARVLVGADDVVALRAQPREDAFGVHQGLGATE